MAQGRKTGGRQKGSRNKKNEAIESITGAIIYDPAYQRNLRQRAVDGVLAPGLETMLFYYHFGRPAEQERDNEAFMAALVEVVQKHASTREAREEIRAVIETHTGRDRIRVVA